MINNIRLKIIAGKINKIPEFYTIFCPKNARLDNEIEARPSLRSKVANKTSKLFGSVVFGRIAKRHAR